MSFRLGERNLFEGASVLFDDYGLVAAEGIPNEGLLKFDLGPGTLLMKWENGHPAPLDNELPTFWAMVPTKIALHAGVALSANFDLDAGRSFLIETEANTQMINSMRDALLKVLQKSWAWNEERQEEERKSFYLGLWLVFVDFEHRSVPWNNEDRVPGRRELKKIIWGTTMEQGSYRQFICDREVVPSLAGFDQLRELQLFALNDNDVEYYVVNDLACYDLVQGLGPMLGEDSFKAANGWLRLGKTELNEQKLGEIVAQKILDDELTWDTVLNFVTEGRFATVVKFGSEFKRTFGDGLFECLRNDAAFQNLPVEQRTHVLAVLGLDENIVQDLGVAPDAEVEEEVDPNALDEYTYDWVKACVALELKASAGDCDGVERKGNREATVVFHKMSPDALHPGYYILTETQDAIPGWFAEEINQAITLKVRGQNDVNTVIQRMSVEGFALKVKLDLRGCNPADVYEAKTSATRPKFLLEELRARYEELGQDAQLQGGYSFKENLPQNLRFVFGPPGTGKTTTLAREIRELMRAENHPHVLFLTPTNKAADVLVEKIVELECRADSSEYMNWLSRFGISMSSKLEENPVVRGKDIAKYVEVGKPATVATTIIRFVYDKVLGGQFLRDMSWDYVIIDESSMIPVMNILYPIFQAMQVNHDVQFIIAGDPFQIAPVVQSEPSKDKNIYTMVGLDQPGSFAEGFATQPARQVDRLLTQYRSIPELVRVVGDFKYDGRLNPNVDAKGIPVHTARDLQIHVDGMVALKPLTLLRFPVRRTQDIFMSRKVSGSSYHVYASLFLFEYIKKLVNGLHKDELNVGEGQKFSIGIISPYRRQADIMANLLQRIEHEDWISLQANTVHGFQGDECDLIIALLNPPYGMGFNARSLINNENILNVAISRAKSYLVVALPTTDSLYYERLAERGVGRIANLMREKGGDNWFADIRMPDLENGVCGAPRFIESNTFLTGHQDVNVYIQPEHLFEVCVGDKAIDIQLNAGARIVDHDAELPLEGAIRANEKAAAEAVNMVRQMAIDEFWRSEHEGFHPPKEGEIIDNGVQYWVFEGMDEHNSPIFEPRTWQDGDAEDDQDNVVAIHDPIVQ